MTRIALIPALLALVFLLAPAPGVAAFPGAGDLAPEGEKKDDGKKDDGGSKFDEPEEEKPAIPEEPVPGEFAFKDFRLEMETEDTRFWSELPISDKDKEAGVCLFMQMKLPKSNDVFDVRLICQAWEHKGQFDFDGRKVGAANYKALADIFYERDVKDWKDVKDEEKPRARRLSREINKAYRYALTGNPGSLPLRKEMWLFKFKDKTYGLTVLYTTTSAKNEQITEQVEDMLGTIREWKEKRR